MQTIRKQRLKLRLSQARLATLSKVSRFKICLAEHGDLELTAEELERIQAALRKEATQISEACARIAADGEAERRAGGNQPAGAA